MATHIERLNRLLTRLQEIDEAASKLRYSGTDHIQERVDSWIPPALRAVESALGPDRAAELQAVFERKTFGSSRIASLSDVIRGFIDDLHDKGADPEIADDLDAHAKTLLDDDVRSFVQEAVGCYKGGHFRAAIVLSWVGAVALLLKHTLADAALLAVINADGGRRFPAGRSAWVAATDAEGLTQKGERDFLDTLARVGGITDDVKKKLVVCLDTRNSCGHPNPGPVGSRMASAHVEVLIGHVFTKF
ncbi:MAG: hypothetical protein Q8P41_26815 [Pseudomonadota bacterium]|nr:hypothetical protein [Pseudomonadota bacterium]